MIARRRLLALIAPAALLGWAPVRPVAAQDPPPAAAAPAPGVGTARAVTFDAPAIGRKSTYNVILPSDYEASVDRRYPVLYLLHGLTGNYLNWANFGAAKAVQGLDLIVVMPDGGNSWYLNWAESDEGQRNAWDDFITKDLIGHVDATYRTIAAREGRAINGLSMGGFGALSLGLRHPDLFCTIGSHSGALSYARTAADRLRSGKPAPPPRTPPSDTPNPRIATEGFRSPLERTPRGKPFSKPEDADAVDPFKLVLAVPKDKLPHIYLDCGTDDRLITVNRDFARLLIEQTIPFTYAESPGGHNGPYWTRELPTSAAVQHAILRRNLAPKPAPTPD